MIQDEQQYRITLDRIALFEKAIASIDADIASQQNIHPILIESERNGLVSVLNELKQQVKDFEEKRR